MRAASRSMACPEAYQRYHEEKARGGIALTMFGGSSNVDSRLPNIFRQLNVGVDEIIPHLQRFSERIHAHGAALMCRSRISAVAATLCRELAADHRALADPRDAPSQLPKEMDEHDIGRVVKAYGAAARRCRDGGLDGIEVLAGGHLIGQFLSPKTNRRTDAFGGSRENRCRFGLMVSTNPAPGGRRFPVGCASSSTRARRGLDLRGVRRIARSSSGRAGSISSTPSTAAWTRSARSPSTTCRAWPRHRPLAARVGEFKRADDGCPSFMPPASRTSRRRASPSGGPARHGRDDARPYRRSAHRAQDRGRPRAPIRPCVGATHCQSPYRPSLPAQSLDRPRDDPRPHAIPQADGPARKVVVVGGGPAGLEAARVCAERGHAVILFEAAAGLGGRC